MFSRFWQLTGKGDLHVLCPIIELNITSWGKTYNTRGAKALTKDDCLQLYSIPSTPANLILKFFCILALHIAARQCETTYLNWECLEVLKTTENDKCYKLSFARKIRRGTGSALPQYCIIDGEIEVLYITTFYCFFNLIIQVAIIDQYISCFALSERKSKDRRFRQLTSDRDGKIISTQKQVGKNTIADFGKQIAKLLGKSDWNLYTSHTFRRTAATVCADAGMKLPQIKSTTGHKSDSVVQGYIDKSIVQKYTSAEALSVSGNKKKSSR